jgi:hypothetical protein
VSSNHEEIDPRQGACSVLDFKAFVAWISSRVPVFVHFQVDEALAPVFCQKQKAHVRSSPTQAIATAEDHVVDT